MAPADQSESMLPVNVLVPTNLSVSSTVAAVVPSPVASMRLVNDAGKVAAPMELATKPPTKSGETPRRLTNWLAALLKEST